MAEENHEAAKLFMKSTLRVAYALDFVTSVELEDLAVWVGEDRLQWHPDDLAPTCMLCQLRFVPIRRRHHCRRCGMVFCEPCSSQQRFGQRVCDVCVVVPRRAYRRLMIDPAFTKQISSLLDSSSSSVLRREVLLCLRNAATSDEMREALLQAGSVRAAAQVFRNPYMRITGDALLHLVCFLMNMSASVDGRYARSLLDLDIVPSLAPLLNTHFHHRSLCLAVLRTLRNLARGGPASAVLVHADVPKQLAQTLTLARQSDHAVVALVLNTLANIAAHGELPDVLRAEMLLPHMVSSSDACRVALLRLLARLETQTIGPQLSFQLARAHAYQSLFQIEQHCTSLVAKPILTGWLCHALALSLDPSQAELIVADLAWTHVVLHVLQHPRRYTCSGVLHAAILRLLAHQADRERFMRRQDAHEILRLVGSGMVS